MKMDLIGLQILIKLIQCILQSRINIQKKQIRHFDEINKTLNKDKSKAFNTNLLTFLEQLLLAQKYNFKERINVENSYEGVIIIFRLSHKSTGVITEAEAWAIQFQQYRHIQQQHDQQEFQIITTFFQELLLFLNKQPLFSQFQRNVPMKNSYILDYELRILSEKKKQKQTYEHQTIMQLPHKYTKERVCRSFVIKIQCYYLPKFDNLLENIDKNKHLIDIKNKKQEQTLDTSKKSKDVDSENQKSRKISIYQIYDKQLDFVFLTSDDENFKNGPENKIKEVDINYKDDTEEFELLLLSKDDEFLDENKSYFDQLSSNEEIFLKN